MDSSTEGARIDGWLMAEGRIRAEFLGIKRDHVSRLVQFAEGFMGGWKSATQECSSPLALLLLLLSGLRGTAAALTDYSGSS